jgi:acetoin utilization deacetylase AcuC-like enzyme
MPKKFFSTVQIKDKLENEIQACILIFENMDPEDPNLLVRTKANRELLFSFTQEDGYSNLKAAIKRTVKLYLERMADQIQTLEQLKNGSQLEDDTLYTDVPACSIQIPSFDDILQMESMPAGADEDQRQRIMNMVKILENQHSTTPVRSTDGKILPDYWQALFAAISMGDRKAALTLFEQFPAEDTTLRALLAVHPQGYLKELITYSIQALKTGITQLNSDIIITPKTFEVLIKDIATTLYNPAKICFSFGLPTHHAYNDMASGFCLINKTAVLMRYWESIHSEPLNYVIVGTDVNRDNGLCQILRQTASHLPVCHIDVFDSRVYPKQDFSDISDEFKTLGTDKGRGIRCWKKDNLEYFAFDLSKSTRKKVGLHPALDFALHKIREQLEESQFRGQKMVLLLPTGWDSHEDETAYCGKYINGRKMSQTEAHKTRFNDGDLTFFYQQLCALYNENKEDIAGIYWGLEGGYDRTMYERQIQLMLKTINTSLLPEESSAPSQRIHF